MLLLAVLLVTVLFTSRGTTSRRRVSVRGVAPVDALILQEALDIPMRQSHR
jgi:hypothetical protein